MDRQSALARVEQIVGPDGLVDDRDAASLLVDERGFFLGEAALFVRPASVEECSSVVRVCNEGRIGIVPQGGNTGLCGGATPFDKETQILLSLSRINRVREIDQLSMTMTVEAGVVLARAQAAAEERDLLFPLSMGSEGSCQIGGNLATNAGGVSVLRYGSARDLVLGLEVVLPNGEIVSNLKGLRKDNTGYDLDRLFVGSEGTLGVITAATVKLYSLPRNYETAWIASRNPEKACRLLTRARRESGDQVVSAELISRQSLKLVLENFDSMKDPFERPFPCYLLLELASTDPGQKLRARLQHILETGLEDGEMEDAVLAESNQQRKALWALRERIPEAEKREGGALKHDISVRVSAIPDFIREAGALLGSIVPHRLSLFGHVGDGNLHYNLLPAEDSDSGAFHKEAGPKLSAALYDLVNEMEGSFSAEHGIGMLKRAELEKYTSPAELELMRSLKNALDPNGIMNPGKLIG